MGATYITLLYYTTSHKNLKMNLLALCFALLSIAAKSVSASVQSCYACAGPKSTCVNNNRTDFLKMDCNTFKVEGEDFSKRIAHIDILERFDNEVGQRDKSAEIGCLTYTYSYGNQKETVIKSCFPAKIFDRGICTYLEGLTEIGGGQKIDCDFCLEDDCNSAISIFFLHGHLVGVIAAFVLYYMVF